MSFGFRCRFEPLEREGGGLTIQNGVAEQIVLANKEKVGKLNTCLDLEFCCNSDNLR